MKITDLLKKHADKLEFEGMVLDVINNAINSYKQASFKPAGAINTGRPANKSYMDNKMSLPVRKKPALVTVTPKQNQPIPLYPEPEKRSW
jgi:hypothetical protein